MIDGFWKTVYADEY